ncbi:MAG: PhnD/SsuA/transferrin family substrate-binding protein [Planctomycetes bacterium]|nr:PhnD/SsuA/transferrin family substrate-binding protein [Planctomycetota bacterium]
MSLACLPWYDFEELRAAHDAFWAALAGRLEARGFTDVPRRLLHEVDHDGVLLREDLLVSQTCGYVVANEGRGWVQCVATPRYGAPGCVGSDYASFIVVREALDAETAEDLRGLRAVANEPLSHSGMNALREFVIPFARGARFFREVQWSGGHLCSLQALQRGAADCAAIDCVAWELVRRHRPHLLGGLRVLATTPSAPAPPFVTGQRTSPDCLSRMREALQEVSTDDDLRDVRDALLLRGFDPLPESAYAVMRGATDRAEAAGLYEFSGEVPRDLKG